MGARPSDVDEQGRSLWSLDRIDPNGNYEPGNCRWATAGEQGNNRSLSESRVIRVLDEVQSLVDDSESVDTRSVLSMIRSALLGVCQ